MNRYALLFTALILGAVVALWMRWQPLSQKDTDVAVELQIAAPANGEAWVRFNSGSGWNFAETRAFWVRQSAAPIVYRIALPPGDYGFFSVSSLSGQTIQVLAGRIADSDGKTVSVLQEAPAEAGARSLFMTPQKVRIANPDERAWWETARDFACSAALFGLLGLVAQRRGAVEKCALVWRRASARAALHPRLCLLAAALAGVVVSCHPVIFSGRSFVSPNNGTLCLYDRHPTLPGAPASPVEQWSSSDVYATLWAHLPYSVVTHRAILRDGELPLWNRYDQCGVTLLGQGQSMPGDPLFWIPVLAGGAAWSWDVRFLVAKALFAFAIGLIVWATTRHLLTAALLTVSAAFLGFFAYRFNHPAFFSVCAAPWILLCWLRATDAATPRKALGWALALVGANWLELNSGTAKEAVMLLLGTNAMGVLVLLRSNAPARGRKFVLLSLSVIAFTALSAPLWLVFLDALRGGYTPYDQPQSSQVPASLLLGLFDDIFYRQLTPNEWHVAPSLNFLVLLGVLWAAVRPRRLRAEPAAWAAAVTALPLLALVFAVVPPAWINGWPFIKNIEHVANTFTCVLIVPLIVLAGFGLRRCLTGSRDSGWSREWRATLLLLGALLALYLGSVQAAPRFAGFALQPRWPVVFSPFFISYAGALIAAVAILPWCIRELAGRRMKGVALLGIVLACGALHFRHGMWLETKFDTYVMNPQPRVDLQARPPALDSIISRQAEPGRVVGFGKILRPGFNVLPGLESPFGSDAVASRHYAEWLDAVGLGAGFVWAPQISKSSWPAQQAALNAMNVRYYLGASEDAETPVAGLSRQVIGELEVGESPQAWPRAFFTDRLLQFRDPAQLGGWIQQGDGRPFAAVQEGDRNLPALPAHPAGREVITARDYRFTANSTAFEVTASGPGVAVLLEAFPARDCRASINGQPVPVVRVNHAFVGVALPAAGFYRCEFHYWPRVMTVAAWISAGGLLLLGAGFFLFCFGSRPAIPAPAHD